MIEAKFTPGPWEKTDFDGGRMAELRVDGKLACMLHSFKRKPTAEDAANLNLIASAPDLYESLELLLRYADDSLGCQYGTLSASMVKEIAELTLAKARGEA